MIEMTKKGLLLICIILACGCTSIQYTYIRKHPDRLLNTYPTRQQVVTVFGYPIWARDLHQFGLYIAAYNKFIVIYGNNNRVTKTIYLPKVEHQAQLAKLWGVYTEGSIISSIFFSIKNFKSKQEFENLRTSLIDFIITRVVIPANSIAKSLMQYGQIASRNLISQTNAILNSATAPRVDGYVGVMDENTLTMYPAVNYPAGSFSEGLAMGLIQGMNMSIARKIYEKSISEAQVFSYLANKGLALANQIKKYKYKAKK